MFYGEYTCKIDKKNRIFLPSRYLNFLRDKTKRIVIITRGILGGVYLEAYTKDYWFSSILPRIEKLKKCRTTKVQRNVRILLKAIIAPSVICEVDVEGRISIPDKLKEYAKIKRDGAIVGVSDRFEIWAEEEWDKQYVSSHKKIERIAEAFYDEIRSGNS